MAVSLSEVGQVRGRREPQITMLAFIDLEERVPTNHPLRTIKRLADEALADLLVPPLDRRLAHRQLFLLTTHQLQQFLPAKPDQLVAVHRAGRLTVPQLTPQPAGSRRGAVTNHVEGKMTVDDNEFADVLLNTIGGKLTCSGNTSIFGRDNTAKGGKFGQCAGF